MIVSRQQSDPNSYSWNTADLDHEIGQIMHPPSRPDTAHAGRGRTIADSFQGVYAPVSKLRNQTILHGLTIAMGGLAILTIVFGISVAVKSDHYNVTGNTLETARLMANGNIKDGIPVKNTTLITAESCGKSEILRTCSSANLVPCDKTCSIQSPSYLCSCRNECVCQEGLVRSGKNCLPAAECRTVDSCYREDWVDGAAIWCGLIMLMSSVLGAFATWQSSYRPSLLTAFFFTNCLTVCLSMLVLFAVWLGFRNGNWSLIRWFDGEAGVKLHLAFFSLIFIFGFTFMIAASVVSVLICYHWNMYGPLEPTPAQIAAPGNAWHSLVTTTNTIIPGPINNSNNNHNNLSNQNQGYPRLSVATGNRPELLSVASIRNHQDDISRLSGAVEDPVGDEVNGGHNSVAKHGYNSGGYDVVPPEVKLSLSEVAMKAKPNLQMRQHGGLESE